MLSKKKSWLGIIVFFALVPLGLLVVPYLIAWAVPERFGQLACDCVIVLLAYGLNQRYWHVPIHFFSRHKPVGQLVQLLPALIYFTIMKLPSWSTMAFNKVTILILLTVMMIAVAEEIICRGLLIPLGLTVAGGRPFVAVLISSLAFGLVHVVNLAHGSLNTVMIQVIFVFASGMLWGAVYLKTHNLLLTIILHFLDDLPVVVGSQQSNIATLNSSQVQIMVMIVLGIAVIACGVVFFQVHSFHYHGKKLPQ